jgi:hypothetical protein
MIAAGPRVQLKPKARGAVLSLPIKLRGEVIGSVDVRAPDNREWDQDEMDIVDRHHRARRHRHGERPPAGGKPASAPPRNASSARSPLGSARRATWTNCSETAALELNRTLPGAEIAIQFRREEYRMIRTILQPAGL